MEDNRIHVSVRELVEFLCRTGDIDTRKSLFLCKDAMQLGTRIHKKIQKSMGTGYRSEVPLKTEVYFEDFSLEVEGRADGILSAKGDPDKACESASEQIESAKNVGEKDLTADGVNGASDGTSEGCAATDTPSSPDAPAVMIDEIKGVTRDLGQIEEPDAVHLAQAKCYAYIYAERENLPYIYVCVTYCGMDTEEIKRFTVRYAFDELKIWFTALLDEWAKWVRRALSWRKERDISIKNIEFPFDYREGQRQLARDVFRSILRKKNLFIQAPTGVGKTMSTVFPAVKALGEKLAQRIFYLTARTTARTVAEQAFSILRERGLRIKNITLTAKEKMCFLESPRCNPDACPYAKGHFDRVNDAVFDMLTSSDRMERADINEYAQKHTVCPYELSLEASVWADAVICDYNYVFDPDARLKRLFEGGARKDSIFLTDEAHNLVERGRQMYSAELKSADFASFRRKCAKTYPKLARRLSECVKIFMSYMKIFYGEGEGEGGESEDGEDGNLGRYEGHDKARDKYHAKSRGQANPGGNYRILEDVSALAAKLMNVAGEMEKITDADDDFTEFYFSVRSFLSIYDGLDENYVIYAELIPPRQMRLKLFCVHPAKNLRKYLAFARSSVFFSATLLPVNYYKNLLGGDVNDYAVYAKSPFDAANRLVLVGSDVSTRYESRGERMYERYATYIENIIRAKEGNYMVFFPSYRLMEDVFCAFKEKTDIVILNSTDEVGTDAIRADMRQEKSDDPDFDGDTPVGPSPAEGGEADDGTNAGNESRVSVIVQERGMDEEGREKFIGRFRRKRSGILVGFAVIGGVFSEGVDLAEESLIGAIIVGAALPQVCCEREILRNYFDRNGGGGFEYAYLYPGMNKVAQAAGRVIRTEHDRGVIALLDERFLKSAYRSLFPREWTLVKRCDTRTSGELAAKFWETRP